jgi:hypothetical protein
MKKRIYLLGLSLVLVTTACTKDDNNTTNIAKASVAFVIDQSTPEADNARQIKRGTIPMWVETLTVVANSNVLPSYNVTEVSTFGTTGDNNIKLDNILIGSNTFNASTTTLSPQVLNLNVTSPSGANNDARFATAFSTINTNTPYVLYNATPVTQNIALTGSNIITLQMKTNNGRILSLFQLSDKLRQLNLNVNITATAYGEAPQTINMNSTKVASFSWSNANSTVGKKVTYTIKVIDTDNITVKDTYTIEQTIEASTSLSCFYILDTDKFTFTKNSVDIILNFQKWLDKNCNPCQ